VHAWHSESAPPRVPRAFYFVCYPLSSWATAFIPPERTAVIPCHPERSAKKRSDRARVEGPLHSYPPTTTSGNSHHALCSSNALPPIRRASCDGADRPCATCVRLCSRTSRACPELVEGCPHLPGRAQLDCSVFVPHVFTLSHPERLLLFLVILSEARRSEATERESKDPCTPVLQRSHQGILTGHSVAAMPCARFIALLATGGTAVLHRRLCSHRRGPGRAQLDIRLRNPQLCPHDRLIPARRCAFWRTSLSAPSATQ
jgi:hypothetical protein